MPSVSAGSEPEVPPQATPAVKAEPQASPAPEALPQAQGAKNVAAEVGLGAVRTPTLVQRVGGERTLTIEVVDGEYRWGKARIESPLPVGYPEPTPPGAIDIKHYPTVRRAELSSSDDSGMGMTRAFFPLFNHIKKREIAMTSPVEMDFPGLYTDFMGDEPAEEGGSTMSFLYRSPNLGPVGTDGNIVVRDAPPITVLSIGAKGFFDTANELDTLRQWLQTQDEWEVAGDPRMFVYNGPFVDPSWRWSEVQVPIRRRDGSAATPATKPPSAAAGS